MAVCILVSPFITIYAVIAHLRLTKHLSKNFLQNNFGTNFKFIFRFTLHSAIREDHKKPIYSVTFNPFINPALPPIFATVGGRQLTIYECQENATRVHQVRL